MAFSGCLRLTSTFNFGYLWEDYHTSDKFQIFLDKSRYFQSKKHTGSEQQSDLQKLEKVGLSGRLHKINYICTFNLTFLKFKKIAPLIYKIKGAILLFKKLNLNEFKTINL